MLYQAVEQSPATIVITDTEGRIVYANPAFEQTSGYTREEAFGQNPRILKSGKTPSSEYSEMYRNLCAGGQWKTLFHNRRKDGSLYWESAHLSAVKNEAGHVTHFLAIKEDITRQRKQEIYLQALQKRTEALLNLPGIQENHDEKAFLKQALALIKEQTGSGIVFLHEVRSEGRFLQRIACLGCPKAGECPMLRGEAVSAEAAGPWARCILEGKPVFSKPGELNWKCSSSMVAVRNYVSTPVIEQGRAVMVAVAANRSGGYGKLELETLQTFAENIWTLLQRDRAQRELVRSNERLRQSMQEARRLAKAAQAANETQSTFLANMSHEIRTPMNGILGMTHLLKQTPLSDEQREYVQIAHNSGQLLLALLNDVLDLSKIEAGKFSLAPALFPLQELVTEICQPILHQCRQKGLHFQINQAEAFPDAVLGDRLRIRQIFDNLLNNAVKFTEVGSIHLHLRLDRDTSTSSRALLSVAVEDTGPGILPERQNQLFGKFQQIDNSMRRKHGGSGLGLYICKQLLDMMGGNIWYENLSEGGSRFSFSLPLELAVTPHVGSYETAEPAPWAGQLSAHFVNRSGHVLVVEDNTVNQQVALAILHKLGIQTELAENGVQALDLLRRNHYSLVLTDVQMPEMDGVELFNRIRSPESGVKNPAVPVIAMTAHALHGDAEAYRAMGMNDLMTKPIDPEIFARVISRHLPEPPQNPLHANIARESLPAATTNKVLNYEELHSRVMGDKSLAETLLNQFLEDFPQQLHHLMQALDEEDQERAYRMSHTIKGASANLSAEEIRRISGNVQHALHAGHPAEARRAAAELPEAFNRLKQVCQNHIPS